MNEYIVVWLDNGVYYLATQDVFPTRDEAERYAAALDPSRVPLVIAGRFSRLHFLAPLGALRQAQMDEEAGNLPTSRETVLAYLTKPRAQWIGHGQAPTQAQAGSLLAQHPALLEHAIKQGWVRIVHGQRNVGGTQIARLNQLSAGRSQH